MMVMMVVQLEEEIRSSTGRMQGLDCAKYELDSSGEYICKRTANCGAALQNEIPPEAVQS